MELFRTVADLAAFLKSCHSIEPGEPFAVVVAARFRSGVIDSLVWTGVFGNAEVRDASRKKIREAARSLGILPASILPLYAARGSGEVSGFTVPAINVRMLGYDTARAVFRAAKSLDAGAVILEIARSEIGYTEQRPAEYAAVVLAAAIKES